MTNRIDAWIHWKKLELERTPDEDEQLFLDDILAMHRDNGRVDD